ncbi:MAG: 50S ribosomal protein L18 [Spirochaetales bacterium]|nr:50S ribosomal protein L18 [Spirochaetales bacterium]
MSRLEDKIRRRGRRKAHIRKRLFGTAERPRMTVFKSARYLYVQVIDDTQGHTLASVSNLEKDLRNVKGTIPGGQKLGEVIAERLKAKSIGQVVFDRNGYAYHGVVKSIADGARKGGVRF